LCGSRVSRQLINVVIRSLIIWSTIILYIQDLAGLEYLNTIIFKNKTKEASLRPVTFFRGPRSSLDDVPDYIIIFIQLFGNVKFAQTLLKGIAILSYL